MAVLQGKGQLDEQMNFSLSSKDDDDKYSLENLLKAQEGGDLQ